VARAPSDDATEEPTPRRLAEARRRGEVAFSRELTSATGLVAALAVLTWDAPALVARLVATLRASLTDAVAGGATSTGLDVAGQLALRAVGPALVAAALAAVAVGLAQTRGLVLAPIRVDLSRVASGGSIRRVLSGRTAAEAAQGLLKVALVGGVAALVLRPFAGAVVALTGASPPRVLEAVGRLGGRLALRLGAVALALGAADALLVARRHGRSLRMTRDEVKREHRESEGDPAHKGERQRLHREILEQRMVDEVRKAHFVVVNPDHIAVALRYDADGDAAPVVVAKGERLVAERIKQIAREAGVPIFRDVGLARALVELSEGGEIPPELYEAVAEILRAVQGLATPAPDAPPPGTSQPKGPALGWKRA
jgi:type III secretion protein U